MTKERKHIENHLLIENKDRKIVRFKLNAIQAKYDDNRTNRDIILKARREGFSSYILALFLIDCLKTPNTRSVVVSHKTEATQRLLERVKRYIERFYDGDEFVKIPLTYNNRSELYFPETNSSFYIGTAGSDSFGRGDTIHNLHLSELAFYDSPKELLTALIPTVPKNGRIVIETTANGFNEFKDLWELTKAGKTAFTPHFFPWWEHDEYTLAGEPIELDAEERNLKARFNLTDDQLRWRREMIREMLTDPNKETTMDIVRQEYPSDDFEAFISSGRPVFNQQILKLYLENVIPPVARGYVSEIGQLTHDEKGYVRFYKYPEVGKQYVIGADVAEGLEKGDYSVGMVLSRDLELVATWHGHIDPDLFAQELVGLARFYNGAVIGCERNSIGILVNQKIKDLGYDALYRRQYIDKIRKAPAHELGWKTDAKTKPTIIQELGAALREQVIDIYEEDTIKELLAYQRDEAGHTNAQEGMHDDRVIALAIALKMCHLTSPMEYQGGRMFPPNSVEYVKAQMRKLKSKSKNYVIKNG